LAAHFQFELTKDPVAAMAQQMNRQSGLGGSVARMGNNNNNVDMLSSSMSEEPCIDFFPTGRTEPARIRVVSEMSGVIDITCASPAEPFEIVPTGATY
jgi:hypothetical protein